MSNELNHKLYHYQATPSTKIWEDIASALDHQTSSLADKLNNYTQLPKADIWQHIEQELNGSAGTGTSIILPLYKRFRQPIKYAAAVAILVVLATGITLFLSKNDRTNEVAVHPVVTQTITGPVESTDQKNDLLPEILQPEIELKKDVNSKNSGSEGLSKKDQGKQKGNRYVTMSDADGHKVRLSKKAFTVFNCAENSTSLNYERCKENILLMQQKMSASLLSPSGDFSGLIEMIKSLEEND